MIQLIVIIFLALITNVATSQNETLTFNANKDELSRLIQHLDRVPTDAHHIAQRMSYSLIVPLTNNRGTKIETISVSGRELTGDQAIFVGFLMSDDSKNTLRAVVLDDLKGNRVFLRRHDYLTSLTLIYLRSKFPEMTDMYRKVIFDTLYYNSQERGFASLNPFQVRFTDRDIQRAYNALTADSATDSKSCMSVFKEKP